ncbi:MAG TPA: cytochrome c oxidase subunit II [Gemmatimonadaceae bacterium]|nr:cytochrome c oxidase subunit II [Gemmatimonadaceae bacterium]
MTRTSRPRHLFIAIAAALPLLLASCSNSQYPNSTFTSLTDMNRDSTSLWNLMIWLGIAVFVLVEALLIYVMIKYRRRPDSPEPEHVHGNTALELTWTILPAFVLAIIAVPTVQQIWKYQTGAPAGALQVEVIGHQWWWEFRYPEQNITTANELYIPTGRPVNFSMVSKDVIHSFWIPQLGGKRDLMRNRTNFIWFTPDSVGTQAFNGSCNEYCGTSHANMRFRAYTVSPSEFDSWVAGQQANAVAPGAAASTDSAATATPVAASATSPAAAATPPAAPAPTTAAYSFPFDQLPAHVVPDTPIPDGLTFDEAVLAGGDAQRGYQQYSQSACIGCHRIRGHRGSLGIIGPDLTHIASRNTIAAGLFPNDARHMALWIKNAQKMKPQFMGSAVMPTLGVGEYDPKLKVTVGRAQGGLTDQQIADIVAYLRTLK